MKQVAQLNICVPAEKHSMKFYLMVSSGVPNIPEYSVVADLEEERMAYFDSSMKAPEARHAWVGKLIEQDPGHWERNAQDSMSYEQLLRGETQSFGENQNQTAGESLRTLICLQVSSGFRK